MKPGAADNTINLGSNALIAVAVLSSADFDAATIDPPTVRLAGAPIEPRANGSLMVSLEDVDGDGLRDFLAHVRVANLELGPLASEVVLLGATRDGIGIHGRDRVRVVGAIAAAVRHGRVPRGQSAAGRVGMSGLAISGLSPNPVESGSVLSFNLADGSPAVLEVWTVNGRLALRRELGSLGPGAHAVALGEATRLPRGTYVVRLSQGGAFVTTKMIILR